MPNQNTTDNFKLINQWLSFCFNQNEFKYIWIVASVFFEMFTSITRCYKITEFEFLQGLGKTKDARLISSRIIKKMKNKTVAKRYFILLDNANTDKRIAEKKYTLCL